MAILSLTDVFASMITSVVGAISGLLFAPLCTKIKTSMDVLNAPESFNADAMELNHVINSIRAMRCSDEIDGWLLEADKIMEMVRQVLLNQNGSSSRNGCLRLSCCIFSHGVSRCSLHRKLRRLTIHGQDIITCAKLNRAAVQHIHGVPNIKSGTIVERNLKQVMDMLRDDEVLCVGLWGPGGVGKTTLANAINNNLKSTSSFSLVILIPLTRDVDKNTLQKAIAKKLKLNVEEDMDNGEIADQIYNRLQREKFLLILDNVWEIIDLKSIGIPIYQKCSKVLLTTRLEKVCTGMKAKTIKIGCLTATEAWQLFVEMAGEVATNPTIQPLAEVLCRECGNLPLALVAVGSTMRDKNNIHQWWSAINDMKSSNPPDGIESQVYKTLKLSFDFLPNDTLRSCFLYCSLYPESYLIPISELVQCWLAENIIDAQLNYDSTYSKGLDLIENLKNSCLLEGIFPDSIKMHDVVRDVAIWIGKLNGTSIVFSRHGISKSPRVALPEEINNAKWIAIVDNKKVELPKYQQNFPEVTTLLLFGTKEQQIRVSEEFLQGFPSLRVLNMRKLQSLSYSYGQLAELRALLLRNCIGEMEELPQHGAKLMVLDISLSTNYEFGTYDIRWQRRTNLNLSDTINPKTLRVLNLSDTKNLETIEASVIKTLIALEVLDMRGSGHKWPTQRTSCSACRKAEAVLGDLSELKLLKEVYLVLKDVNATYLDFIWIERLKKFQFYCGYDPLHRSVHGRKRIHIRTVEGNEVGSFVLHTEILILEGLLGNVNKIFASFHSYCLLHSKLKSLEIINCWFSQELDGRFPNYRALPNLYSLSLYMNKQVRSLYRIDYVFAKLRSLDIFRHPELENVFSSDYSHIVLPQLEKITIQSCENIKEVLHDGPVKTQALVPRLKCLTLDDLKNLHSLCNCELSEHWQSLEVLNVSRCPNLKKLPHVTSIKEIRGTEEWWNNLEWRSPETKSYMNQFFKPLDCELRGLQFFQSLFGLDDSK